MKEDLSKNSFRIAQRSRANMFEAKHEATVYGPVLGQQWDTENERGGCARRHSEFIPQTKHKHHAHDARGAPENSLKMGYRPLLAFACD